MIKDFPQIISIDISHKLSTLSKSTSSIYKKGDS